jgi:hypothetical protein
MDTPVKDTPINRLLTRYTLWSIQNNIELGKYEGMLFYNHFSNSNYELRNKEWYPISYYEFQSKISLWKSHYSFYDDYSRVSYYYPFEVPGFIYSGPYRTISVS